MQIALNEYGRIRSRACQIPAVSWPREILTVHCYFHKEGWYDGVAMCREAILWHVEKARQWGVREVWVTEFGPLVKRATDGSWDWDPAVQNANDLWEWMENYPEITRVYFYTHRLPPRGTAWYWPYLHLRTDLFEWNSDTLTLLGKWYRSR